MNMNQILKTTTIKLLSLFILVGCGTAEDTTKLSTQLTKDNVEKKFTTTTDVLDFVDPFIGTDGKGKTYPGATQPYGMVQLSPDNGRNGWDWISGYFYPDTVLAGFSHTHLSGTGAGDLYDISFMPITGEPRFEKLDDVKKTATIVSSFSHENEQASPGYYQVYLDDYNVNVELTASLRTGVQKYTFDKQHQTGQVKLDLDYSRNWDSTVETELTIINDRTIAGYRKSTGWAKDQRVYFYTVFSEPMVSKRILLNGEPIRSCLMFASQLNGQELVTIEGLSKDKNFEKVSWQ